MLTTKKLLSDIKKKIKKEYGKATVYRIAKELDVSRPTVDRWEEGKTVYDENAIKIAVYLNLDPEYVIACMHAERAKGTEAYPFLVRLAERAKPPVAA